jgi:hypothetical protein
MIILGAVLLGCVLPQVASASGPPSVTTQAASSISKVGATLNATVNPNGETTIYDFEYGETSSYGLKTAEVSAGAGASSVEVSRSIEGLQPGTTYHFRIAASNGAGTAYGSDRTFVTASPVWSVEATVNKVGSKENWLRGVSCSSTTRCMAVGSYKNSSNTLVTLAERRPPLMAWQAETTPNPTGATESVLSSVSCVSPSECMAVGWYKNSSGVKVTLAERWISGIWSIVSTPNPSGAKASTLLGVSCTSSTACTAVGSFTNSSGVEVTAAEGWNGTVWSLQESPNPSGAQSSILWDVSCSSSTACTAAGRFTSSGIEKPLAENWNGSSWTVREPLVPSEAKEASNLNGVSCISTTVCTAAGQYYNGSSNKTLVENWNGSSWSLAETPNPSSSDVFEDVSCATTTVCTAVGHAGGPSPLAEHLSASVWSAQETAVPADAGASPAIDLSGVSCSSPTECTAVGQYVNSSGTQVTLAELYR